VSLTGREIEMTMSLSREMHRYLHEELHKHYITLQKRQSRPSLQWVMPPTVINLPPLTYPDYSVKVDLLKLTAQEMNYGFGAALHEVKHVDSKAYHKLAQSGKTKFRAAFQRRADSKSDSMKKHRAAWSRYQELLRVAEVTKKLTAVTNALERPALWP
jgi:hypothetical protein